MKVSKPFVNETLWPEFVQINAAMRAYLDGVTDRIIADAIHSDSSEGAEVAAPAALDSAMDVGE